MRRKKIGKHSKHKFLIVASSIIVLNIMGISYANWDGGLDITSKVNTGNMSVQFIGGHLEINGDGHIDEQSIDLNSNNKTMNVFGKIVIDYDETIPDIILNYDVVNSGSIPAANLYYGNNTEILNLQTGTNNTELTFIQR